MHVGSRLPTDVSEFNSDVVNSCGVVKCRQNAIFFFISTAFQDLCVRARAVRVSVCSVVMSCVSIISPIHNLSENTAYRHD